jgi:hypothetical protein
MADCFAGALAQELRREEKQEKVRNCKRTSIESHRRLKLPRKVLAGISEQCFVCDVSRGEITAQSAQSSRAA